jgi:transglutaminase-like putative cysteine protease
MGASDAARLGHAVTRTLTALPFDDRCLSQALVLVAMLARRGTPSTLVIGARAGAEFGAHAWVEVDGLPVLLADEADYPRLAEL